MSIKKDMHFRTFMPLLEAKFLLHLLTPGIKLLLRLLITNSKTEQNCATFLTQEIASLLNKGKFTSLY